MKIILADLNPELIKSWKSFFSDEKDISIIQGNITDIKCDAIVSPANSFGFMDGGIDYALLEHFGWTLQESLQQQIKLLPEGELLVGQAIILETGDNKIPFLISAPTMRVPMDFNIHTSLNAYLAMKAILIKAKAHPSINSVAVPGLCTGSGRMPPAIAARQMRVAYNEIILGMKMDFDSFVEAQDYHLHINPDGKIFE